MNTAIAQLIGDRSRPKVAFFSPLWGEGGLGSFRIGWSDYWRLVLPAIELHRNGWDVVFARAVGFATAPTRGSRLSTRDDRLHAQDPNGVWHSDVEVVVWSRAMGTMTARDVARARGAGQVMVNDLDDWFWDVPPDHPYHRVAHPEFNRENYAAALRESDLITVSTPWLAEAAGEFGPPVKLLRNLVDLRAWALRPPGRYVGWVGQTDGRSGDLAILRENVVPWLREPFYHGGARHAEPRMADVLGYGDVQTRSAQGILTYPRLWDPLRIALVPLDGSAFSQAKSWVKGLEACARGIPFVASAHPEYEELGVGMIAREPGDWSRYLEELRDPEVYAAEARANRARAEELSICQNWMIWAEVLTSVVGRGTKWGG